MRFSRMLLMVLIVLTVGAIIYKVLTTEVPIDEG